MNNINQAKKIGDGISSSSEIASTISSTVTSSLNAALTGSIQDAIDASLAGFSGGSGDLSAYQSTTPTITTTAVDPVERSTITVIISDYNAANEYTIDVTDGTTTRTNGSISWELPFVPGVPVTHTISVGAIEPGMLVSVAAELSVDVQDEQYGASYINYSDTNFDTFTLTNATIKTDGDILATSAGAIAESPVYTQDTELGDYHEFVSGYISKKQQNLLADSSVNEFKALTSKLGTSDTVGIVTGTGTTAGLVQELALTGGTVSQGTAFDMTNLYLNEKYNINDFASLPATNGAGNPYTLYDPQFSNNGLVAWYMHEDTSTTPDYSAWLFRIVLTESYNLSTAASVTVSPEIINLISGWRQVPGRFFVKGDGSKVWLDRSAILNVPGTDASAITFGGNQTLYMGDGTTTIADNGAWEQIKWADSGTKIIIRDKVSYYIFGIYPVTTAYDPTTISTKLNEIDTSTFFSHNTGAIDISPDGTKLFLSAFCYDETNGWHREIKSYSLGVTWDLSTSTELVTQIIPGSNGAEFMYVSSDGRTLHMTDAHATGVSAVYSIAPEVLTVDTTSVTAGETPTGVFIANGSGDETYIKFEGGVYTQLVEETFYASYVSTDITLRRNYETVLTAPANARTIQSKVILSDAGDELEYLQIYPRYTAFNSSVDTPVISSPIDTATDVGLSPLIQGSTYNGTEAHASSDWQIATDAGFTTVVYEDLASTDLESHTVGTPLEIGTTYYVRVRYNSSNIVSSWSAVISFDTLNVSIDAPSFSAPSNNASGVLEGMTFTISAFSGTDTFVSSVIEIASDSGFSNIIDTITTNSQLTDIIYMNPSETTTYFARVKYVGAALDSSWSTMLTYTTGAFINENVYTTAGTFTWVCPIGVTSVSALVIGGGGGGLNVAGVSGGVSGGGGGGGLGYKNNITVVPGQSYTVVVGAGASHTSVGSPSENGGQSSFNGTYIATGGNGGTTSVGGAGGTHSGCDGGGNGGTGAATGRVERWQGGGGAAGYSGNGGNGGEGVDAPTAGNGGGAGGGWSYSGGGVGIFGQGANGAAATNDGATGFGGSGGENGDNGTGAGNYGGGGGGNSVSGGSGAVRIIWGVGRLFPSNAA